MISNNYVLTNPISLLLDKTKDDFTRDDLIKVIEKKKLERITFHYTALDGKLKELKLPIANRYLAECVLTDGERVDGSSLFKGMIDVALSDLYVVPVYRTAFLNPFDTGSLDFICRYLTSDGELAPFTLDSILANAYHYFKQNTKLKLHAMGELEFFILSDQNSRIYPSLKQKGYHSAAPFVKTGQLLNEMVHHITQITGSIKYAHSEVGYVESVRSDLEEIKEKQAEQLEIEFIPTPIDETGDNLVLAKWLIRNIAYKHNCVATFAPKLEEGIAGNGLHIHMALMKNGKNFMTNQEGTLNTEAKKIIGGLCTYADSLTAFGNTVSSAYLRLVPNQEAPTHICWSNLNRSAMIRVPLGWSRINNLTQTLNPQQSDRLKDDKGTRQTIELRSPDGSAIIHLLLAGITLAANWGLKNPESLDIANKLHVKGNVFQNKRLLRKLPVLPKSCVESSRLLLKKRSLYEKESVFPSSIIDYVVNLLREENDEKINQKLMDLPADDRLHATRKIMHKHLHRH